MSDWNTQIIEEFRAHEGRVGGQFDGARYFCCTQWGPRRDASGSTP